MTRRLCLVVTGLVASCEAFTAPPAVAPIHLTISAACFVALWILLIPEVFS